MNRNLTKTSNNALMNPWSFLRDEMWDVFDKFSQDLSVPFSDGRFIPKIEIQDTGSSYQVSAEVPGMDEKDINITMKDNNLILEGEKRNEHKSEDKGNYVSEFSYGSFFRAIPLSEDIDPEKVSASYNNGVLEIELQKRPEEQRKARKIEIGGGKEQKRLKKEDVETKSEKH